MKVRNIVKIYIVVMASIMMLSWISKEQENVIEDDALQSSLTFIEQVEVNDNCYFVDLGLKSGTLWSTCNIGASAPYGIGSYFAWGEIVGKDEYEWETYKYFMVDEMSCVDEPIVMQKYNCNKDAIRVPGNRKYRDDKSTLENSDDAAYMNSGGLCKIPSVADWKELFSECKRSVIEIHGVKGSKIESANGNYIFIPYGGFYSGKECENGDGGFYWTSDLEADSVWRSLFAHTAVFGKGYGIDKAIRFVGMPIRPIKTKKSQTKTITKN